MAELTFDEALFTDADGRPRTIDDIIAENKRRDEAKIASVTKTHLLQADDAIYKLLPPKESLAFSAAPLTALSATSGLQVGNQGVDFSWAKPGANQLAGHRFVMVYLPYPGDGGKSCSRAQVQAYLAAGLHVIALWEVAAGDCLRGAGVGQAHGEQARQSAYDNWGLPLNSLIVPACDTDTTYAACKPYLDGFDSRMYGQYLGGPYGGINVTEPAGQIGYQTFQTVAWSRGLLGAHTNLYQKGFNYYPNGTSANCDLDVVTRIPINSWATGFSPQGGFLMSLSDAQQTQVYNWLKDLEDKVNNVILDPNHGQSLNWIRRAIDDPNYQQSLRRGMTDTWREIEAIKATVATLPTVDQIVAAVVAALPAGTVDVNALAAALAPLLPKVPTSFTVTAA